MIQVGRLDENRTARLLGFLVLLLMAGCTADYKPLVVTPVAVLVQPAAQDFVLLDGTRLPYRQWMPERAPAIVVLALHGFNDSSDAWEYPAPALVAAGIGVVAPDQRGFGFAPERGRWVGTAQMVADAAEMTRQVRARFPAARLYLMGESMGAATLLALAASGEAPAVDGYVFSAPAVWGRGQMNLFLRATLWVTNATVPGMVLGTGPVRVKASDNRTALERLSTDSRTIRSSRVAAVKGLVDLMTDAQRAAPGLRGPALFLYGGRDELVPRHATQVLWDHARADGAARFAWYPDGYHLLLRDTGRALPTGDIVAWLRDPRGALPSGEERVDGLVPAHRK